MRNSREKLNKLWDELQNLEDTYGAPIAPLLVFLLIATIGIPTARDVLNYWDDIESVKRAEAGIILLQTVATVIGGIAIFWNIVLSRKQITIAQRQMKVSQDQMITDMLSRAIEQLGHEQSSVRIGAIYSLERIARESNQEHCSVMEIISSYIRDNTHTDNEMDMPGRDIQAAIIVLGRREVENDKNPIYLNDTNLAGIDFSCGSQTASNFEKSDLSFSKLSRADFFDTNLENASLYRADLRQAKMKRANLRSAYLRRADLGFANLKEADLSNADLSEANLVGVRNLRVEQVRLARNWEKANYDPEFRKLLE